MLDGAQVRQASDEHHPRITDGKKNAGIVRVNYTPARATRKRERGSTASIRVEDLKFGLVDVVSNAGDDGQISRGIDCNTVRPWRGWRYEPCFQSCGVQPR